MRNAVLGGAASSQRAHQRQPCQHTRAANLATSEAHRGLRPDPEGDGRPGNGSAGIRVRTSQKRGGHLAGVYALIGVLITIALLALTYLNP